MILIGWIVATICNYYYTPWFYKGFVWIGLVLILIVATVPNIIVTENIQKNSSSARLVNSIVLICLLFVTLNTRITSGIIERIDIEIFMNKRNDIVKRIKQGELAPNVRDDDLICQLPFKSPRISDGGNQIIIKNNEAENTLTVKFWTNRPFFNHQPTYLIYSNDSIEVMDYCSLP